MIKDLGRCSTKVYPNDRWGSFHGHLCLHKPKVIRDGKPYCNLHDPVMIKQKDEEKQKRWDKENEESHKIFRRKTAMIKACYDISTEDLERINIKELIKKLNEYESHVP